jgi:hypothetical protein
MRRLIYFGAIAALLIAPTQPLRVSNAVAIVLVVRVRLPAGTDDWGRPWVTGGSMILLGCAMVAVAAALGG